jgi:hypothetical protein
MSLSKYKENILDVIREDSSRDKEYQLEGDGWSVMEPHFFEEMGFNPEFVDYMTHRKHSGTGKHSLFDNDGNNVKYIDGVYYLDLLEVCANIVEPKYSCDKMGRGWRARAALDAMRKAVAE